MHKFIFIFLAYSLFATAKPFTDSESQADIDSDYEVAVINQDTGQTSHHSIAELAVQVETLQNLIAKSSLTENHKNSALTQLAKFGRALTEALTIGASVVMIIAGGYVLFKFYKFIKPIYKAGKYVFLKLYEFCRYTKTNVIDQAANNIKEDFIDPIAWLLTFPKNYLVDPIAWGLKAPSKYLPEAFKDLYIKHNADTPFM